MVSDTTRIDDDSPQAAALLDTLQGLLGELRPRQAPVARLGSRIDDELGLDSLSRVELVVRLEERFGVRLPSETFAAAETPRDLLRAVLSAAPDAGQPAMPQVAAPEPTVAGMVPEHALTLPEVLRWHADAQPDRPHIRLLKDGREVRVFTYRQLLDAAQAAAVRLQARAVLPGQRVALMLPTGEDYFIAFFAILLCGAVPVPIYPPVRLSQLPDHLRRHAGILANSGACMLITVAEAKPLGRLLRSQAPQLDSILTLDDLADADITYGEPHAAGEDVAFLQYTSGSTGAPKGVVLSHADLLANIRAMGAAIEAGPEDVFVSWLPLYHDMGLIGAWLGSLYYGIPLVIMSPLDFIARPLRWLQAMSQYGGTLSAAPNFGYELCLKRITDAQAKALDLSRWRAAFNGAEPVSPDTLARFTARFAAGGFRAEAAMPVYGLAEAAVGLAFPPLGRAPLIDRVQRDMLSARGRAVPAEEDDASALQFPSCGQSLPGYALRVVDDQSRPLPDRRQGRIEFRGPSATRGYFMNPEATARLRDGDWLDTGDLGYLAEGELYLTGRAKDMVIRAGRNLYPQDLEDAVGGLDGVRKGCVAVFGSPDQDSGTERLVVLAETRWSDVDRQAALRQKILELGTELLGAPPEVVHLVPPHAVLKTSSGKIRRSANRDAFERGELGSKVGRWGVVGLLLGGMPGLVRHATRRLSSHAFAAWAWTLFWLLAPLTWLGVVLLPRRAWRFRFAAAMARTLAFTTFTGLRVTGAEHLPAAGRPCLVVANHASYLDGPVLMAVLPWGLSFVAKEALAPQFIAGTFLRRLGAEFVERFDSRRGIDDLQRITRVGQAGRALLFFAEGTFSPIPGLRPFHMGAFVTAVAAHLPVVPVAISGTRSILRAGSWYPRPGAIRVVIGEPIEPPSAAGDPRDDWRAAVRLRDQARAHILKHCGEPDLGN